MNEEGDEKKGKSRQGAAPKKPFVVQKTVKETVHLRHGAPKNNDKEFEDIFHCAMNEWISWDAMRLKYWLEDVNLGSVVCIIAVRLH